MIVDIKRVARERKVTLTTLAERLGVSRQSIHYYIEQGDKNPVAQLERIARALGCQVSDFFVDEHSSVPSNAIRCPHCGGVIKIEKGE